MLRSGAPMYLWCDGAHDPAENMRRDAALLAAAERSPEIAPVLRLFRFAPHGITLGYAQHPDRELDLDCCRRAGVPWAVRPTGGRAIFHAEEWTYSLAARIDDPDWGGSLREAYKAISELLVRSLIRLGVPARSAPAASRSGIGERPASGPGATSGAGRGGEPACAAIGTGAQHAVAAPCFVSTARHEVVLDGRKLVGSAQRRTARALLQQGSLLLGTGHLRLVDYLAIDDSARAAARDLLNARASGAEAFLGDNPPLERWAAALTQELPGVRRIDDAAGLFLLTPPEPGFYTVAIR